MSTTDLLNIAPFLRGLTFDGEKGQVVHCRADGNANEQVYDSLKQSNPDSLPPLFFESQSEGEMFESLRKSFNQYTENHHAYPSVVIVEDTGFLFLGESYDRARDIAEMYERSELPDADNAEKADDSGKQNGFDRNRVVKNKIAVVTGAAQGFGENIARYLAGAGSLVFIADINLEGAKDLVNELNVEQKRTTALPVKVDVSSEESVADMVDEIVMQTGGIDLFISNAGVLRAESVKEMTLKTFKFVTDVNYIGYFLCTKYASPVMARQNEAAGNYFSDIIQINSKSGLEGSNKNAAYAGGKFGGIGLTQSFAKELVEDNIKVNSICPGNFFEGPLWSDPDTGLFVQYLETGKVPGAESIKDVRKHYESQVPMKRGCRGEDVIKAIYYLVEQKYETGQAVPVTGGQVMLR
jgi:sorbitol-6-phosphate 2-dehydrogenase